jgi:hypothetical protein
MKAKKILVLVAGMVLFTAALAFSGIIAHEYDQLNRIIRTTDHSGTMVE